MRLQLPAFDGDVDLDSSRGLSSSEVVARRRHYGTNAMRPERKRSLSARVREIAADPMLWFLLATSSVYLVLGETLEGLTLLAAVLPLTCMDAVLHHRTRSSTRALEQQVAARALVVRDGRELDVPADDVVVGDLICLRAPVLVPSDGVLLDVDDLQIEQSALTGEAYPVRKRSLDGPATRAVDEAHWALAGTRVLSGWARMRVVRTGKHTLYGEIMSAAALLTTVRTPLQVSVAHLVITLSAAATVLCLMLAAVRVLQGHGWADALISGATLAVAALPEEFPIAFTFFVAAGVYRLARRRALVQRAVSVENIGRVSAICSDKTGTMTEGNVTLTQLLPAEPHSNEELLAAALHASREESSDAIDAAVARAARERALLARSTGRLAVFPFTEERRRETLAWDDQGDVALFTKGSPEVILDLCPMPVEQRNSIERSMEAAAERGGKLISCARMRVARDEFQADERTSGFTFLGTLVCEDPIRPGVAEALQACARAGIRTIMVTGDHVVTARAVARSIGLAGPEPHVVLGADLEAEIARHGLSQVAVVARALPTHKLAVVRALQAEGHVVAATGDGINDVPALQAADVGIAMGERATQSAREAAAMVLLDDSFRTLVRAISEGRRLFQDLRASFYYLLVIHTPFVITAAFIPLAGYPLLYLPVHVVWLELTIHPTALLAFQSRESEGDLRPERRSRRAAFFSRTDWLAVLLSGALSTFAVAVGYLHSVNERGNVGHGRAMALVTLVLTSVIAAAWLSRLGTLAAKTIALASVTSAVLLVHAGPLPALLHLEPLHISDWALALTGAIIACLPLTVFGGHTPAKAEGPSSEQVRLREETAGVEPAHSRLSSSG